MNVISGIQFLNIIIIINTKIMNRAYGNKIKNDIEQKSKLQHKF